MTRRRYDRLRRRADLASLMLALPAACVPHLIAALLILAVPLEPPMPPESPKAYATVPGSGLPTSRAPLKPVDAVLDVVAVVSNPARFERRYQLYRDFERHVLDSGARPTTVELAYGSRPFEVTEAGNPRHVQVRSSHEFWHKENLINLGVARVHAEARYIAWVDADLTFARPDWVQETIQQLQHHAIVQMFSEAHDLGPDGLVLNSFRSFGYSHVHGIPRSRSGGAGYYGGTPGSSANPRIAYWHHPGFAWAARREAFDALGGLFDVAVVGEADYIMAKSLMGEASDVLYPGVFPGYRRAVENWQSRALKLRGDLGYVPGTVLHHWHGKKANRQYWSRCRILAETGFDPSTDLIRDGQGLYQLVDHGDARSATLRDALRAYFRSRNEDGTEL